MRFPDLMVDTETTGLDPDKNGLLQIAAIKFNYDTGEVGPTFDRCLALAPNRYWDEDTRTWWMGQNRSVFTQIVARMEDPQTVLRDFSAYVLADNPSKPTRFWAKPTHFDFPMINSHYRQFGMVMPFHHRFTRDLNSVVAVLGGGVDHQEMAHISAGGQAHNALVDCVHQLRVLFAAKAGDFGTVEAEFEYAEFTEVTD